MLRKLFAKRPPPVVRINPSGATFEVGKNQTILECALAGGLNYPHDCTVGTCGRCRSKLLSGKVDAITPFGYTLSKEELAAGFILACQAVPTTDVSVEVEMAGDEPRKISTSAKILATRDLTHDIKEVSWECAVPVTYRPGQYMNVIWPGAPANRSYSFAKATGSKSGTVVTTFVRKVPGGTFTEALFSGELAQIEFKIDGPHGDFWLRSGEGPILLVGGGSGLAPLLAVLEDAAARGVRRNAILLFGARGERDLYCQEEIARIANNWPSSFEYRPVLSEEDVLGLRNGLVTAEIGAAVDSLGGSAGLQAYLCGPPGMIDAAIAELGGLGVPLEAIHYDKFTDASHAPRQD